MIENIDTYPENFEISIRFKIQFGATNFNDQDIIDFFYDEEAEKAFINQPITKVHFNLNGNTGYFKVNNKDFAINCIFKSGKVNFLIFLL